MAKHLPRRTALVAASAVFALAFLLFAEDPSACDGSSSESVLGVRCLSVDSSGDSPREQEDETPEAVRRRRDNVINTFFEPIDRKSRGPLEGPLPRNSTEARTLDTWRSAWESRGWTVRVLTLDDARRHPDFDKYNADLNSVPLGGNGYYNRLCYLRWLAMAAVGGGWMSDFDVLPISGPSIASSAEANTFTSYGGSVPSLLHGSSQEWTRMSRLLLNVAKNGEPIQVGRHQLYSDMMALQALRNPPGQNYNVQDEVLQSYKDFRELVTEPTLAKRAYNKEECNKLDKFRAAHFSHVTVAEALGVDPWKVGGGKGVISLQEKLRDRPLVMQAWMDMLSNCGKIEERFAV